MVTISRRGRAGNDWASILTSMKLVPGGVVQSSMVTMRAPWHGDTERDAYDPAGRQRPGLR